MGARARASNRLIGPPHLPAKLELAEQGKVATEGGHHILPPPPGLARPFSLVVVPVDRSILIRVELRELELLFIFLGFGGLLASALAHRLPIVEFNPVPADVAGVAGMV